MPKCPICGSNAIPDEDDEDMFICEYCGNRFYIAEAIEGPEDENIDSESEIEVDESEEYPDEWF